MRESHHKGSAFILMGRYGEIAFVKVNNLLCQGHAYTIPGSYILVFSTIKQFEQVFFIHIRHAYPVIRQANDGPLLPIGYQD